MAAAIPRNLQARSKAELIAMLEELRDGATAGGGAAAGGAAAPATPAAKRPKSAAALAGFSASDLATLDPKLVETTLRPIMKKSAKHVATNWHDVRRPPPCFFLFYFSPPFWYSHFQSYEETGELNMEFCDSFSDTLAALYSFLRNQHETGFTVEGAGWLRLNSVVLAVADNFAELETVPFRTSDTHPVDLILTAVFSGLSADWFFFIYTVLFLIIYLIYINY